MNVINCADNISMNTFDRRKEGNNILTASPVDDACITNIADKRIIDNSNMVLIPRIPLKTGELKSIADNSRVDKENTEMKNTPYQRLKNSRVGKIIGENKFLTGAAAMGSAIVTMGGAEKSEAFAQVAEHLIVPAVAGGTALLGATLVHDGIANDLGRSNGMASVKITGGTVAALGGTQIIGTIYRIPYLEKALSWPLSKLWKNSEAILGAGVMTGGAIAGKFAADKLKEAVKYSEKRMDNASIAVISGIGSAAAVLGGAELIGNCYNIPKLDKALTGTIEYLSKSPAAEVAGGGLLVAGAGVMAIKAGSNFKDGGNDLITAAESMGAVTAGLGGVEMAGNAIGIEHVKGLLTNNIDTVASSAVAVGGAALVKTSLKDVMKNGVGVKNSLGITIGSQMIETGIDIAVPIYGVNSKAIEKAAELVSGASGVAESIGLGLAAYACGKNAVKKIGSNEPFKAALYGTGAVAASTGSLIKLGTTLNIDSISDIGVKIFDRTLKPIFNSVVIPLTDFLFKNPEIGAVAIAVGTGAYLYSKYHDKKK